jgi:hypothetical protein
MRILAVGPAGRSRADEGCAPILCRATERLSDFYRFYRRKTVAARQQSKSISHPSQYVSANPRYLIPTHDANGQTLDYVYCEGELERSSAAYTRRIAANIAKLPDLLQRPPRPDVDTVNIRSVNHPETSM